MVYCDDILSVGTGRKKAFFKGGIAIVFSAWLATLLASALPEILLHELGIAAPDWLVWLKLGALGALIILSLIWKKIRPLSPFFVVLFALLFGIWIMDRFQSTASFKS